MKLNRYLERTADIFLILLGTFLYALGLFYFITPSHVAAGGVTGISIILNYAFHLPVGILVTVLNLPLIVIGWRFLGRDFIWKTVLSVVSFSVMYDKIFPLLLPTYEGDRLLACLFGGLLEGIGLGLLYLRSGSNGGTDIINKLLHRKLPHIPLGRVTMLTDLLIVSLSVFVFGSIESALYAVIIIFVCTMVIDLVVYGGDKGKLVYIFSETPNEIAQWIMEHLERGVTCMNGTGVYTGREKKILLCALRKSEYPKVKKVVRQLDPHAFLIVSDASEVAGKGFKPIDRE